jgi:hypothetical protein
MANLSVGDRVSLSQSPPYLKTADAMPVMRSAQVVPTGSQGVIIDRRPGGYWVVLFPQGRFLVDGEYLTVSK